MENINTLKKTLEKRIKKKILEKVKNYEKYKVLKKCTIKT